MLSSPSNGTGKPDATKPGVFGPTAVKAALLVFLLILAFGFQGSRPIYDPDEGRYTDVALQMLDSGDWWLPKLHPEQTHFTKPPLTYWCIAASLRVFGRNAWAARLPYALAFALTGVLVFSIAGLLRLANPWGPPVVWATSLAPFVASNLVTTDTLLVCFETAAVAAFIRARLVAHDNQRRWLILMWLAFGLAFMTKGPPGLLPLLVIVAWTAWQQPRMTASLFEPWGLLLFAVIGLGWYASVAIGNAALVDYFVRYEFVDRIFTNVHARNPQWTAIFTIYGSTLVVGTLPWLPLALAGRLRQQLTAAPAPVIAIGAPAGRLLWLWLLVPLTVFCFAHSRLPLYILPLFVPISLLVSPAISLLRDRYRRDLLIFLSIWTAGLIGLKAVSGHLYPVHDAQVLSREIGRVIEQMTTPPDEIAFIEIKPAYSLRFYLGLPIEDVALRDVTTHAAVHARSGVCQEVIEGEHPLWLLPAGLAEDFTAVSAGCGYRARPLAETVRGWMAFELLAMPEESATGQDPAPRPATP
jgi:4-amino-4-deoxy-L-arabinose transferase-like glycosyltransferase